MRIFRQLLLIMLLGGNAAFAQTVSFTFDDPRDPASPGQDGESLKIRQALSAENLHVTLFVCGMRVDSPSGVGELNEWRKAGHEIGNHTYSHLNLSSDRVTLEQFIADAGKNDGFLRRNSLAPVRFRFPFLKEGDSREKRDGMRAWLARNNYSIGAVSIDASDWYYDQRYSAWRAKNPAADDRPFKAAYLEHLWGRARYYESLAQKYLGRSAPHALLLHVNKINARFLPDIIAMFRGHGWRIVDSRTAYEDPLYLERPGILPAGESILWQIAKRAGDASLRYPAEDSQYEQPILDALGL